MESSTSAEEWTARTEEVTAANGGELPGWWPEEIVQSRLQVKMALRWVVAAAKPSGDQPWDHRSLTRNLLSVGLLRDTAEVDLFQHSRDKARSLLNLTTEAGALELMRQSLTRAEWVENTVRISEANGGTLPEWWQREDSPVEAVYQSRWQFWQAMDTIIRQVIASGTDRVNFVFVPLPVSDELDPLSALHPETDAGDGNGDSAPG